MKKIILSTFCVLVNLLLLAQTDNKTLLRLPITDYMISQDSIVIVQVRVTDNDPFTIKDRTMGALHRNYKNASNFDEEKKEPIGAGRCHLIKGEYYYFALKMLHDTMRPMAGDLLSFFVDSIPCYRSILYNLSRENISFINLEENELFATNQAFFLQTENEQTNLIEKMVDDIRYTGREMLKLQPEVNYEIKKDGYVKGKKLLDFLKDATYQDVVKFLKYIQARPERYAGSQWKIGEVFATWADAGAPTVTED